MEKLAADLKYGVRMMLKAKGVTVVALLSLALGIGANTALYSVAAAVVFRVLPVKNPEELVVFNWQAGKPFRTTGQRGTFVPGGYPKDKRGGSSFQPRLYEQMRDSQRSNPESPLASVFAYSDLDQLTVVVDQQAATTLGRGRPGPPHRLRQRGQSFVEPLGSAVARDHRSPGPGRRPGPPHPADAD